MNEASVSFGGHRGGSEGALGFTSKGVSTAVKVELNLKPLASIYSSTETLVLPSRVRGCIMLLLKPLMPGHSGHGVRYSSTPRMGRRSSIKINEHI